MHELFFPDGSCPSDSILQRFLKVAESTDGDTLSAQIVSPLSPTLAQYQHTICNTGNCLLKGLRWKQTGAP